MNFLCYLLVLTLVKNAYSYRMDFSINTTWDDSPIDHDPVKVWFYSDEEDSLVLEVRAPFFKDPPPKGEIGEPFPKLWDYEVVEVFFLGDDGKYLEIELSPHGQHLLLLLSGSGNAIRMCLPLTYAATITGNKWHGIATIPSAYFPPGVRFFNAYAIHGTEETRTYEALCPVPKGMFPKPNFHRLEFFRMIDFRMVMPHYDFYDFSAIWKHALEHRDGPLLC